MNRDKIQQVKVQFEEAMNDDFNTANAISALFELAKHANTYLKEDKNNSSCIDHFTIELKLEDDIIKERKA